MPPEFKSDVARSHRDQAPNSPDGTVLVTVTVSPEFDPSPRPHPELLAVLRELGGSEICATEDAVYMFRVPRELPLSEIERFAEEFLGSAPNSLSTVMRGLELPARKPEEASIVVQRRPGVMDPVEGSVLHALRDAGVDGDGVSVRVATRYRFSLSGVTLGRDALEMLAGGRLANAIVEEWSCAMLGESDRLPDPFRDFSGEPSGRVEVPVLGKGDEELLAISDQGGLSLDLDEMKAIVGHFVELDRDPTEAELETIAQTWSEHCCHKTLTGPISYEGETIGNLLRDTIFAVTKTLDRPWCWSVFRDNAGVIAVDEEWGLSFKVETHNHPSALEPYGGAGTGIGGVIRDTLGTGLGAEPVLNTDVFCFAPLDTPSAQLPPGTLPPQRLLTGVVGGVRDYGNRMGIPTANGAIIFHPGYVGNPLVFCGSVGLIRREHVDKEVLPGDRIIAIGGRTGRDGIHGATFSSRELTEESESVSSGAVQIGNPIEEKKVLDVLLRARDEGLFRAVTDCGAGGFSSAVGEMGEKTGAVVQLDRAPLKYPGLSPTEIWISEAQERMVFAVPPEKVDRLFELLAEEEVEGCDLGHFADDGVLRLYYHDEVIAELSCAFLHDGRPDTVRVAEKPTRPSVVAPEPQLQLDQILEDLLSHGSIASKEPVIRQYDHEVQGRMVLRPLAGAEFDAPMDGCAFDPSGTRQHTAVVACGLAPLVGEVDCWQMGAHSVDEALRNVIVSGGSIDRVALLDNFAWGNVRDPQILGSLIEASRGASVAAITCEAPFVSGKDSLHNTYRTGGVSRSIPATLLISALSVAPGTARAPGSDLKRVGSTILHVGPAPGGVGGSHYEFLAGGSGGPVPAWDENLAMAVLRFMESQIASGIVRSAHDVSDGGLAVAAAEMAFGGSGVSLDLELSPLLQCASEESREAMLFSEGPHRFLVEVENAHVERFCDLAGEIPVVPIGQVVAGDRLRFSGDGETWIEGSVSALKRIWQTPLERVWPGVEV